MRFTAFCTDTDDWDSTTWIESFEAQSEEEARAAAVRMCADDWGYAGANRESVKCIGIAEGDVKILFWED